MGKGLSWTYEEESVLAANFNSEVKIVELIKSLLPLFPNRTHRAIENKIYDLNLHVNISYFKKFTKEFKVRHNLKTNADLSTLLLSYDRKSPASQSTLSILLSNKRKSDKTVKDGTLKRLILTMKNIDNSLVNTSKLTEVKQIVKPTIIKRGRKPKNDKLQTKLNFNGIVELKKEVINTKDKSTNNSLLDDLDFYKTLVDRLDAEISVLRSDLNIANNKYVNTKSELDKYIDSFQSRVEENYSLYHKDAYKNILLRKELNKLKETIKQLEQDTKSNDYPKSDLEKENKLLMIKLSEVEIENKELKSTIDQLNFKNKNTKVKNSKDETFVSDGLLKEKLETKEKEKQISFWSFLKF
jgi:hypothetical protein